MKYYIDWIGALSCGRLHGACGINSLMLEDIMKKGLLVFAGMLLMIAVSAAQEKKAEEQKYKLTSEQIDQRGKNLDAQIATLANKMADVIKKYNLLKATDIRVIPYQTTFVQGDDFIEINKYSFIKEEIFEKDIVGVQSKKIKIYTNGQSISKIESEIYDHNYWAGTTNIVRIIDPSPTTENTDDVVFTHAVNGKLYLENKKLGDVKNSTAYAIRNDLKRDFLVPHMTYFLSSMLFIAESYMKGFKDSEAGMNEFLKRSKKY